MHSVLQHLLPVSPALRILMNPTKTDLKMKPVMRCPHVLVLLENLLKHPLVVSKMCKLMNDQTHGGIM
jgi:hypothetical protein